MYGQIGCVHKDSQKERFESQIFTNKYGNYAGNNLQVNRHLPQNGLSNQEDASVKYWPVD